MRRRQRPSFTGPERAIAKGTIPPLAMLLLLGPTAAHQSRPRRVQKLNLNGPRLSRSGASQSPVHVARDYLKAGPSYLGDATLLTTATNHHSTPSPCSLLRLRVRYQVKLDSSRCLSSSGPRWALVMATLAFLSAVGAHRRDRCRRALPPCIVRGSRWRPNTTPETDCYAKYGTSAGRMLVSLGRPMSRSSPSTSGTPLPSALYHRTIARPDHQIWLCMRSYQDALPLPMLNLAKRSTHRGENLAARGVRLCSALQFTTRT